MTSLIGFLSLVSALTATSSALWCMECYSTSSTCKGNSVTCPSGFICGSLYSKSYTEEDDTEMLIRECRPPSECTFNGTMTIEELYTPTGISCCSTDGCTPTLPTLPLRSTDLNGVICPTCWSSDSATCYTSDTMQCTGDENRCLLTTIISESSTGSTKGCATKSFCDLGNLSINTIGLKMDVIYTCSSAHKVILTPAIVCLLLLKLFL